MSKRIGRCQSVAVLLVGLSFFVETTVVAQFRTSNGRPLSHPPVCRPIPAPLSVQAFKYKLPDPVHFDKNSNECKKWVEAHRVCGEAEYEAAKSLLEATNYVPFSEFSSHLNTMVDEFNQANQEKNEEFMVVVDQRKSSEWVAHLIEKRLNVKNLRIVSEDKLAFELSKKNSDKLNIIKFDDAIYTGSQMSEFLRNIPNKNIQVHLIVPYATQPGMQIVTKQYPFQNLHLYAGQQQIPTISEKIVDQQILATLTKMYPTAGGPQIVGDDKWTRISATFFQHKVPDFVSAPSEFFKKGAIACIDPHIIKSNYLYRFSYDCIPSILPPYKLFEFDNRVHRNIPIRDSVITHLIKEKYPSQETGAVTGE